MRKLKRMTCEIIMLAIEDERKRLEEAGFLEIGVHVDAIRGLVESYLMIAGRGRRVKEYVRSIEIEPDGFDEKEEERE